jgi:sporulation protein YlmC with PRC-barrel domain
MLKRLLATTAIILVAGSAFAAETATQVNTKANAVSADHFLSKVTANDILATTLIGMSVYGPSGNADYQAQPDRQNLAKNGQPPAAAVKNDKQMAAASNNAQDMQSIGDINDLVVADNGTVEAVIIGVGGFLGIGEKNVAVPFENLTWSTDANGNRQAMLATTKEELQNAPAFDVAVVKNGGNAQQQANGPAVVNKQMAANPPAAANTQPANPPAATRPMAANQDVVPPKNATAVDINTVSANDLKNTTLYDANNKNVGEIGDVILTKDGKIDAVIVDIGGFLGIGEKPVAIAFDDLVIRKDENNKLYAFTRLTKEQFDSAPQYDKNAYENQRDRMRLHSAG